MVVPIFIVCFNTFQFGTFNQTATLTHHSSAILTPTSLWPKNSIHSIHPLHCLPPLLSNDYKREHASCCPLFEQRLHNQKLRSKGHALGGSEIDKITTKEKMKRKMVLSSSLNWNTSKMKNLN